MNVYKLKESQSDSLAKGRLIVKHGNEYVLLATPTVGTLFIGSWTVDKLKNSGVLEEVVLDDEKWVHPHLYKPVREIFLQESKA